MSTPEEIAPGIFGISLGFVNAFVLADEQLTLVDTGLAKSYDTIAGAVRAIGRGDVANVALTHHHGDHMGSLSRFAGSDTKVFAHPLDADVVRGDRKPPGPAVGGPMKLVLMVARRFLGGTPPHAKVDTEINEGDTIPGTGGLRAVHTPGHTAGHVSFLHPDKRVLFVGDAAANRSKLALPPPFFTEDMAQAKRTLAKIAELDFDTAVFGHGMVLRGKANAGFRVLADSLAG